MILKQKENSKDGLKGKERRGITENRLQRRGKTERDYRIGDRPFYSCGSVTRPMNGSEAALVFVSNVEYSSRGSCTNRHDSFFQSRN